MKGAAQERANRNMIYKFSKTESRILIYGPEWNYKVVDCNCREDVEEVISKMGNPVLCMKNFDSWQELARARKYYEWEMSASPRAKQNVERPTDEDIDWFWQKELVDSYTTYDIKEVNAKYDHLLPDSPYVYLSSKENLRH